jgi:predicted GTPase
MAIQFTKEIPLFQNVKKAKELKEKLTAYKPVTEADTASANILLIGQIGAGKSSFFNSINSIFNGKITSKACSGRFEHSVTTYVSGFKFEFTKNV